MDANIDPILQAIPGTAAPPTLTQASTRPTSTLEAPPSHAIPLAMGPTTSPPAGPNYILPPLPTFPALRNNPSPPAKHVVPAPITMPSPTHTLPPLPASQAPNPPQVPPTLSPMTRPFPALTISTALPVTPFVLTMKDGKIAGEAVYRECIEIRKQIAVLEQYNQALVDRTAWLQAEHSSLTGAHAALRAEFDALSKAVEELKVSTSTIVESASSSSSATIFDVLCDGDGHVNDAIAKLEEDVVDELTASDFQKSTYCHLLVNEAVKAVLGISVLNKRDLFPVVPNPDLPDEDILSRPLIKGTTIHIQRYLWEFSETNPHNEKVIGILADYVMAHGWTYHEEAAAAGRSFRSISGRSLSNPRWRACGVYGEVILKPLQSRGRIRRLELTC
ncbi:hypothetical protein CC2G_004887 [Coprinopsis cinerea AmutBmut pab1-1]|nr:hypothetical protein CC2G_004887 [Coprinopsis cinerea AmutBmut pab1-1]